MPTFKGSLNISRRQREFKSRDPNYNPDTEFDMEIQVSDENHSGKVLEIKISGAELMNAIANLHGRPCTIELFPERLARLGKRREVTTFDIKDMGSKPMQIPKPITNDGWVYSSGYGDYRRAARSEKGGQVYSCSFVRYVEVSALEDSVFDNEAPDLPWESELPKKPPVAKTKVKKPK